MIPARSGFLIIVTKLFIVILYIRGNGKFSVRAYLIPLNDAHFHRKFRSRLAQGFAGYLLGRAVNLKNYSPRPNVKNVS